MGQPITETGDLSFIMNMTDSIEQYLTFAIPPLATPPLFAREKVLQPVWDLILDYGQPYVSHWLIAGWLTFATYMLICFFFTYKGSCGNSLSFFLF